MMQLQLLQQLCEPSSPGVRESATNLSKAPASFRFDGPEFKPELDGERLTLQHEAIRDLMLDGKWRTLGEIASLTRFPEPSISAQLRHLRKPRFGSFVVEKRRRGDEKQGLYEYHVSAKPTERQ